MVILLKSNITLTISVGFNFVIPKRRFRRLSLHKRYGSCLKYVSIKIRQNENRIRVACRHYSVEYVQSNNYSSNNLLQLKRLIRSRHLKSEWQ